MGLQVNDLNTYDGKQTVYPVVNESVNVWREALSNIPPVKHAASILSGGEISYFCVAPRVKEKLVLLDHSYQSMYYALGKFHLIDKFGSREAFRALRENDRKLLREVFAEANKGLPTEAPPVPQAEKEYEDAIQKWNDDYREWEQAYAKAHPDSWRNYSADFNNAYYEWMGKNPQPKPPPGYRRSYRGQGFEYWWHGAQRVYEEVTQQGITEFRRHRNKVEFVHGDLTDLAVLGPFDLVYLSNALSYSGRNGKTEYKTEKWVKPGGYVCLTYSSSYAYDTPPGAIPKEAEKVFEYNRRDRRQYDSYGRPVTTPAPPKQRVIPTQYGSAWTYGIYKLPE